MEWWQVLICIVSAILTGQLCFWLGYYARGKVEDIRNGN